MSEPAAGLAESGPSDAGRKGPKRLFDDKDFWKIYEKGETIGRGHFAKVKLVRHRSRRDSQPCDPRRPTASQKLGIHHRPAPRPSAPLWQWRFLRGEDPG